MVNISNNPLSLRISILAICAILLTPFIAIFAYSFEPFSEYFYSLIKSNISSYVLNSIILTISVALISLTLALSCAWLVAFYDFPLKKLISNLLILPLAMPAYIVAFVYADILEFSGPVQTLIRSNFNLIKGEYYFPSFRSLGGAIVVMSFVFYPYIYIICKIAFEKSTNLVIINKSLGKNNIDVFKSLSLAIRPAIIAGLTLVIMETLADFGAVKYLDVQTFTTAIYRSWYLANDFSTSAKLSSILLLFVISVLFIDKYFQKKKNYSSNIASMKFTPTKLLGYQKYLAVIWCLFPVLVGFLIPVMQLIYWSVQSQIESNFIVYLKNSVNVSIISASLALFIALIFSFYNRNGGSKILTNISCAGYALPGSIVAVGVLIAFIKADHALNNFSKTYFNTTIGLILSGSILTLIFANIFRFLAVAFNNIDSHMQKIGKEIDYFCQIVGKSRSYTLQQVHMPMIKKGTIIAFLLVFVECMKELPATLIIRPFNFDTLATATYQLVSDERLIDSSNLALMMIFISMCAIYILNKLLKNKYVEEKNW